MAEEYGAGTGLGETNKEIMKQIRNHNPEAKRRNEIVRRLQLSPTRPREPEEANVVEANVSGLLNNKLKLPYETIEESMNRLYVFLYLKMRNTPLDDNRISSAHTIPNDNLPLKLEKTQINEISSAIKVLGKVDSEELSLKIFHTEKNELDKQIRLWEKPNKIIYYGTEAKFATSSAGGLNRTTQSLTDNRRHYLYNIDKHLYKGNMKIPDSKTLGDHKIITYNSIEKYVVSNDYYSIDELFIVVSFDRLQPQSVLNSKNFTEISFIKDAFSEGNMALIHPRLGFIIQNSYPDVWAQKYWIADDRYDPITRIVFLTLQKYSAIRRYYGTGDDAWSSTLYKQDPFDPQIAYELKNPQITVADYDFNEQEFLEELIDNQVWAMLSPGHYSDYKKYKVNNNKNLHYQTYKNSVAVPYNTLEDLNSLLPTPPGFTSRFYWQVYDTNNINKPKSKLRHRNVLRYISTVKRNRNKNRRGANTAKNMVNMWDNIGRMRKIPQYATQNTINSYYKDFFNTNPPPPIFPNVPKPQFTWDNSRLFKRNIKEPRAAFGPSTVRRTRKSRKSRKN